MDETQIEPMSEEELRDYSSLRLHNPVCRRRWWNFWKQPHDWGYGRCVRCGLKRRCGQSDGGLFVAYHCTEPINHTTKHIQGDPHGANASWANDARP